MGQGISKGSFPRTLQNGVFLLTKWSSLDSSQVRKQQLELDMEQQTGSKKEKEYVKAAYCHPAYLTYMQGTSCEILAGWIPSQNQDWRIINNLRYTDDTTLMAESEEELKTSWWKWKWKVKKLA